MTAQVRLPGRAWRSAANAVAALEHLDETAGEAVWLQADSVAAFVVASGDTVVRVDAGPWSGPAFAVPLSPRFVAFVGEQAVDGEEVVCTLVDGATAVHAAGALTVALDLVAGARPVAPPDDPPLAAAAWLPSRDLVALLELVRRAPSGVDLEVPPLPPVWLGIDAAGVTAHADWRERRGGRGTYRVAATEVVGEAVRSIGVAMLERLAMYATFDDEEDAVAVLRLPEQASGMAQLRIRDLAVWAACRDMSVARWRARLQAVLAEHGIDHEAIDDRSVVFVLGAQRVLAELLAAADEVVRLAVVVVEGVEATLDLLREVNQANAGLVGVRLWCDERRVVAACDLPLGSIGDVLAAAASLTRQVDGPGLFLGATGCT